MSKGPQGDLLAEPFCDEVVHQIKFGGTLHSYIPVAEIIARLNQVLGTGGWSKEVICVRRNEIDNDEVTAHVRVMAVVDGNSVTKDGMGGTRVKRTRQDNRIVDLGNDMKSAVADAFKKACQDLGVGLYLARSGDALALEAYASLDISDDEWAAFRTSFANLSEEKKELFWKWWASVSDRERPYREMDRELFDSAKSRVASDTSGTPNQNG
jgi:hypothetical protein